MFDLSSLIVSAAMAQDMAPPAPEASQAAMMSYAPFILIFAVFYFLVIRPQQKKLREQEKMIKALQRGDKVITTGGIYGKVTKLDGDSQLMIEIANGVEIKIERSHIMALETKPQLAVVSSNDSEKK